MPRKAKTKKIKIEKDLESLEKIVEEFEKGKLGIEEGMDEYEKAAKLIKAIKSKLTALELKIQEIKESY